jgi:putative component of membrane protein insertase Oxa1/YidC/SpoIIIJ protein YidD
LTIATTIDNTLGRQAVRAILGYQRYLSPIKGFACAHRRLHGNESCSQYVKRLIAERGLREGLGAMGPRFRACRAASLALNGDMAFSSTKSDQDEPDEKPRSPLNSFDCCETFTCAQILPIGECPVGACELPQTCELGSLDFAGCDASALDCGGCG